MAANSYKKELGFSVVVTGICALLTIRAFSYPGDSSQFPRFLTVTMTLLSIVLLARALRSRPDQAEAGEAEQKRSSFWTSHKMPLLIFLLTALYVVAIQVIGYFTSTVLFLVGSMAFFGRHRPWVMFGISALFLAVIYALFVRFLGLRLPEGLLF